MKQYGELLLSSESPLVRWGIRNQILLPFAAVLLAAVALTAFSAAYLAAERTERDISDRLDRVMSTLGRSNFPYSQNVLEIMQGLSGAEFVAVNAAGEPTASTVSTAVEGDTLRAVQISTAEDGPKLVERPILEVDGRRYLAAGYRRINPFGKPETLYVLYPQDQLAAARREAAMPPVIVGGITLVALAIVAALLASRMGRRIRRVQEQVARIADGDFTQMQHGKTRDEIFELVRSINKMAARLQGFEETIERTERSRVLGQLAGGLAHQLRNAVTGARLAIQIHQKRCESDSDRESLDVALRQLELTEEHVKSLLSVGRPEPNAALPVELSRLLEDVATLVSPVCHHENVRFSLESDVADGACVSAAESVRTAVLNMVLNAVEAAGPHGTVCLAAKAVDSTATITVTDDGPGPPEELAEQLFDPFITGKPEGVGLGLAQVKQVADQLHGSVDWSRQDNLTVFRMTLPIQSIQSSTDGSHARVFNPSPGGEGRRRAVGPKAG